MTAGPPSGDRLPDGFAVRLDPAVRRRDGGAALLGGSPLRLVRLSPRARALLAGDRLVVRDGATAELAGRLLDGGLAHPDLAPRRRDDVTVVVPVRDRPEELARLLAALRADPATAALPVLVVDDGSAGPVRAPGVRVLRHGTARGPAAARNTGLRAATTELVAFLDSDCVPRPGWLEALAPHLDDPRLALVAPRVVGLPPSRPSWLAPYETVAGALDMGPRPAPVRPLSAVSYVPSAALLARRAALGDGFDEAMRVAEDVDLVWRLVAAGRRVRYEPAARVAHDHRTAPGAWLLRRAFYGTGAAPLAARHGALVSPLVVSPWSVAAWALLLAGRRGLLPAAGVVGAASVRLAVRLARPGEPAPWAFAAGLVLRGTATAGTTLARAVTRHHWPLAAAAALASRRARRLVAAVAVADAVHGWWPHRREVGLLRFAAARRLEDLAYGAGLWAGAARARDARALLPTVPPRF
ncbi:mycofactocin biosynthesis glycosyltransferase MftF [Geodermatophilus sp. SYSU D00815]